MSDQHVHRGRCDHTPVDSYATRGLRLWAAGQYPHGPSHDCLICVDTRAYLARTEPLTASNQRQERSA